MPPSPPPSLASLLVKLVCELFLLVAPIALTALTPITVALVLTGLVSTALAFCVHRQHRSAAPRLSRGLTGMIIGLSLNLLWLLPAYWNMPAGLLMLLGGLGAQATWERRHGLMPLSQQQPQQTPQGASAWGGGIPEHTPEGEPIRILGMGEIAMGGPVTCDYLFSDGVLLCGLGSAACFSDDGRHFAAPIPSRQSWGLAILDRQQRRLYLSDCSLFWELDEFADGTLRGRYSPLTANEPILLPLTELLATAKAIDLVAVGDLWLTPEWQQRTQPQTRPLPLPPAGEHRLSATRFIPERLRELEKPLTPLSYPVYALAVDGQPSGLLIDSTAAVVWRNDGLAFGCRASAGPERAPGIGAHWLWSADNGWRSLPYPWVPANDEPMLQVGEPQALSNTAVVFDASLDYPLPSEGRHGQRLSHIHGETEAVLGHSPEGRLLTGKVSGTALQLVLPLSSRGERGAATIESMPLDNGERARLRWASEQGARGLYECRIGDWPLPGQWLLDHRVSDCGRYIALLPAPDSALPAGAVVVADVRQRRLRRSSPRLVARLLDFRDGVLSLAEISGHHNDDAPDSALCRIRQAAPPPEQAAAFLDTPPGTGLVYQCRRFEMHDDGLTLLPDWRLIDRPQVAIADGDFIYPAPDNRDAAWLFGAATEYGGSVLHPAQPRRNGHLLTASGCALGGLTPAMIWSADGRWLALTRILEQRDDAGRQPWQLLILDPAEKRLCVRDEPLGYLPDFESFDEQGLRFRVHQYDWEVENDVGQPRRIAMEALRSLPWAPLVRQDGWAFGLEQEDNRAYWEAWDRSPLQPWMQNSEEAPAEGQDSPQVVG